jgi:hypothetical protein
MLVILGILSARSHRRESQILVASMRSFLLFRGGDGPQHQGMRYFQRRGMRLEVIVDPAGEHGRLGGQCLINAVNSMGRCNTQVKPNRH